MRLIKITVILSCLIVAINWFFAPLQSAAMSPCQATDQCQGMGGDPYALCSAITNQEVCQAHQCCSWINLPGVLVSNENEEPESESGPELIIPDVKINLPGLLFSDQNKIQTSSDGEKTFFYVPWIGEYINWLYNYSIGIIALLAIIAIMIGGFYWLLAGGNASRVSEAKSWINAALSGLVLALSSYILLFTINSNLVSLPSIKMMLIKKIDIEITGDTSGPENSDIPVAGEYPCPSGNNLQEIITQMRGQTTYHYGGKYNYHPRACQSKYCLDCSGFVDFVRKCAGFTSAGEHNSTKPIFDYAKANNQLVLEGNTAASIRLIPGDLVGWPRSERGEGHVFIYIGRYNNASEVFVDAHGPENKTGRAISTWTSLESIRQQYQLKYGGVYYYRRSQGYRR